MSAPNNQAPQLGLSSISISAGHATCHICAGRLSWEETVTLAFVAEAMTDHLFVNHRDWDDVIPG